MSPTPVQFSLDTQTDARVPLPAYSNPHQYAMPGYHCCDNCAAPKEEKKQKTVEAPAPTKWQGRTRAEVDEDNMKIAAGHGAYDERKVEPKGLKPDQMVWVVEPDGAQTLRYACFQAAVEDPVSELTLSTVLTRPSRRWMANGWRTLASRTAGTLFVLLRPSKRNDAKLQRL